MLNNLTPFYILLILNITISAAFILIKLSQRFIIGFSAVIYCNILKFIGLFFTLPLFLIIAIIGKDYLYGELFKHKLLYAQYNVRMTNHFLQELSDPYLRLSAYALLFVLFFSCLLLTIYHRHRSNALLNKIEAANRYSKELFCLLKQVKSKLKIQARITIYRNSYIPKPCLIQLEYPTILIPEHDYTNDQLCLLIEHELYHLKHHDLFFIKLANFYKLLFWYNPIITSYANTLLFACELANDERMIATMSKAEKIALIKLMSYCLTKMTHVPVVALIAFSNNKPTIIKRAEFIIAHKNHQAYRLFFAILLIATLILTPLFCYRLTEDIFELLPSKFKCQEIIDTNKQII